MDLEEDYPIIKQVLETLSTVCQVEEKTIIDLLIGWCWDEEEGENIKNYRLSA